MTPLDVAVIGGGVIGLSVAAELTARGRHVTLYERQNIAAGASAGNAAGFARSEISPLASSANLLKAFGWLLDRQGPFAVRAQDLGQTGGWLWQFLKEARPAAQRRTIAGLAALMEVERQAQPAFLARQKLAGQVRDTGALHLYRNPHALDQAEKMWQTRAEYGVPYARLSARETHQRQAGLATDIAGAIYTPDWESVDNPKTYCEALHRSLPSNLFVTEISAIDRLEPVEDGVILHSAQGPLAQARHVVLAAGPWSATLAGDLGDKIPLIGERGYNTTFPKSVFPTLERPLFFSEEAFVMVPLCDGIRIGGASEIAALDSPPNYARCRHMVAKARAMVPGLGVAEGTEWFGRRPTIPDTLPVMGPSSASPRITYAFGHGHLGLTLSVSTGVLVADIITDKPRIDISAYAAQRFT